jgi:hypothetical protein
MYLLPLHNDQDIGARAGAVTGMYAPEYNNQFSYAYTYGDARVRFPQAGTGQFIANVRMGGPNGAVPITAYLETPRFLIGFGSLKDIRVYHVLMPADPDGDVEFHIRSSTTQLKADPRRLGVLLDWIQLRALSIVAPPVALLIGGPLVLALLWLTIRQIHTTEPFKVGLLLLCSALLCASFALSRGKLTLPAWWLIVADIFVMVVIGFTRFDEWRLSRPLPKIAALLLLWRTVLWLVCALGTWYSGSFLQFGRKLTTGGAIIDRGAFIWRFLADAWVGWDGGHYRNIAVNGYSFQGDGAPTIAFFPLYPLLIRLFLPLAGNVSIAALIVTHLALFIALIFIYDLVAHDFNRQLAHRTLVLLLIFPTSFYFASAYSESLGLALLVAALWAMRRQRWWLAGLAGGLLALTRLPGVFIAPVLACAYLQQHRWRWRSIGPDFLSVVLPPLGLLLFMVYQWWRFGTPVAFLIAQRHWGNGLAAPWVMPHTLLTTITTAADWPMRAFQLVVWVSFIGLILFALLRLPLPYGLTVLLLLLPPYLSPWHDSFPRYVLIGFPAFVVMAIFAQRRWIYTFMVSAMLAALAIGVLLFTNGFWVA